MAWWLLRNSGIDRDKLQSELELRAYYYYYLKVIVARPFVLVAGYHSRLSNFSLFFEESRRVVRMYVYDYYCWDVVHSVL